MVLVLLLVLVFVVHFALLPCLGYAEDPKIPSDPIHPEPNLVKDILKGLALGLTLGFLWKIYHWNLQKKIAGYYDKQESK